VDLNLGPRPRYPRLRSARPDSTDLKLFMETVKTFVELGGEVEQSVVRDRIGLPDPPTGPQVKLLRPSPGGGGAPIEPAAPEPVEAAAIATAAQEHSAAPDGDAVDDLVARELENEGWRPLVDPIVRQIESVLGQCRTADEFLARLPELAAGLDTDALADRLGRAMIAARLAGEGEEELGGG
ncbi:MAG: hypothetical protein RLZZ501_2248, partial [Pseudomonadota bacterium]